MRARELITKFHTSMLPLATPSPVAGGGPQTLLQAVQAAVEKLNLTILQPVARSFSNLACHPKFMLALLTYCYARQIYRSADIARALATDTPLANACQNQCPSTAMISQFRDHNRQAIRACLTAVLSFLARQKVDAGLITKVNEANLAEEASRRLIMAMCADKTDTNYMALPLSA
jgi:hypothetical protein